MLQRGQQEATERPAGGYREASRRLQRGQQDATERPAGGYKKASRRIQQRQQEPRSVGGYR
jgi:hypothetical protein